MTQKTGRGAGTKFRNLIWVGMVAAALGLASCVDSVGPPGDVQTSRGYLKTAVEDAEEAARRVRAFRSANLWNRADKELDSAKLILHNALQERARIRRVYDAAIAVFDEAKLHGTALADPGNARAKPVDVTAAADRVERIGAALSAADRDVETIEQTVAMLDLLEIFERR